ncbi:hypothetical protein ACWGTI_27990 [Mesorhizobium sp. ArgA1]
MATDDSWRLDGKPFERGNHPQALDTSFSQGRSATRSTIGCTTGAFDENFRTTATGSRSSLSCREHKLEGANR